MQFLVSPYCVAIFWQYPLFIDIIVNCNTRNKDVRCGTTLFKALESCIEFDGVFLAY